MEKGENLPLSKTSNELHSFSNEGPIRKYLSIINSFENIQPTENKKHEIDFSAVITRNAESFRILRTHKSGDTPEEKIVTDSINDNAYGMGNVCVVVYTLTKDLEGNKNAVIRHMNGDLNQKLPALVEKLGEVVTQEGAIISFMPGNKFVFDGKSWNEVS